MNEAGPVLVRYVRKYCQNLTKTKTNGHCHNFETKQAHMMIMGERLMICLSEVCYETLHQTYLQHHSNLGDRSHQPH